MRDEPGSPEVDHRSFALLDMHSSHSASRFHRENSQTEFVGGAAASPLDPVLGPRDPDPDFKRGVLDPLPSSRKTPFRQRSL